MQLLATVGEEHGITDGLDITPGRVTRLPAPGLRLPHIGWNDVTIVRDSRLFGPAGRGPCFYYLHSFHYVPDDPTSAVLLCGYGEPFVAAVERENVFGMQFHPEKSHAAGLSALKRFTEVRC